MTVGAAAGLRLDHADHAVRHTAVETSSQPNPARRHDHESRGPDLHVVHHIGDALPDRGEGHDVGFWDRGSPTREMGMGNFETAPTALQGMNGGVKCCLATGARSTQTHSRT